MATDTPSEREALRARWDGLVAAIQRAEVTDTFLRELGTSKHLARAAGDEPPFAKLSMVEAVIVWWEMDHRAAALTPEPAQPGLREEYEVLRNRLEWAISERESQISYSSGSITDAKREKVDVEKVVPRRAALDAFVLAALGSPPLDAALPDVEAFDWRKMYEELRADYAATMRQWMAESQAAGVVSTLSGGLCDCRASKPKHIRGVPKWCHLYALAASAGDAAQRTLADELAEIVREDDRPTATSYMTTSAAPVDAARHHALFGDWTEPAPVDAAPECEWCARSDGKHESYCTFADAAPRYESGSAQQATIIAPVDAAPPPIPSARSANLRYDLSVHEGVPDAAQGERAPDACDHGLSQGHRFCRACGADLSYPSEPPAQGVGGAEALLAQRAADALAQAALWWIDRGYLDARSSIGDRLLDYVQTRFGDHFPDLAKLRALRAAPVEAETGEGACSP